LLDVVLASYVETISVLGVIYVDVKLPASESL